MESPRAKLETIRRILESTQDAGGPKHRLMYESYLSYLQMDEYLLAMAVSGLVRRDPESRRYTITGKGMDFLDSLRQMEYFMKSIDY